MQPLAVILPAGGSSTRFGRNKLTEPLGGRAVIARSLAPFLHRADVEQIVIPTSSAHAIAENLPLDGRIEFCDGGACRAASVYNGLKKIADTIEWIAIHDAARPLVTDELISATLQAAREHGAAVGALPVNLTIKQAAGPLPARVDRTIARDQLWAMQTPQIVRRADLLDAFARCPLPLEQITDDVQLLELIGKPVWLIPGRERNLKITTPVDLKLAELLLAEDRS